MQTEPGGISRLKGKTMKTYDFIVLLNVEQLANYMRSHGAEEEEIVWTVECVEPWERLTTDKLLHIAQDVFWAMDAEHTNAFTEFYGTDNATEIVQHIANEIISECTLTMID